MITVDIYCDEPDTWTLEESLEFKNKEEADAFILGFNRSQKEYCSHAGNYIYTAEIDGRKES